MYFIKYHYRRITIAVIGLLISGKMIFGQDILPAPRPTRLNTGKFQLGAFMCPLWNTQERADMWDPVKKYPERKPLFGYYPEGDPALIDWEIKYALDHGISFFNVCWYRQKGNAGKPVEELFGHWTRGFFKSRYHDQFKICLLYVKEGDVMDGIASEKDFLENLVPYWIENFFRKKEYLTIDGKPVFTIYRPENFISDLGGLQQARAALIKMREACKKAGLPGIIIGGEYHGTLLEPQSMYKDLGLDIAFSYHWPSFTEKMPLPAPADTAIIRYQTECWPALEQVTGLPSVATASVGWDSRPWGSSYYKGQWKLTPATFTDVLQKAKKYTATRSAKSLGNNLIMLDNWNEYAEGHYIFPTIKDSFSYLEAVRKAMEVTPSKHIDDNPYHIAITQGKLNHATDPFVDPGLPVRFSWMLSSTIPGQRQTAYRVLVSSSKELLNKNIGDIWDGGKIRSDSSQLVNYRGKLLNPQTIYYWKVKVWGADGYESAWSSDYQFETGLQGQQAWQASWITAPDSLLASETPAFGSDPSLGLWSWTTMPSSRNYFRKDFETDKSKKVVSASIRIQCDNSFELFVNGRSTPVTYSTPVAIHEVDILPVLQKGINKIGIKAYGSADPTWFVSSLRAAIKIKYQDGNSLQLPTDLSWGVQVQSNYYSNIENHGWDTAFVGYPAGVQTPLHPRLVRHSLYFRKQFNISASVASARLYATAKGLYEFRLNGKKISEAIFTPGTSEQFNYYQVYDVTASIKQGDNAIAAITGNGWYNEAGWQDRYAKKNELIAMLVLTMQDGTVKVIGTDDTWKTALSPVLDNGFQGGERYDARKEITDWDQINTADHNWSNVIAGTGWNKPPMLQPIENIYVKHTPTPKTITRTSTGSYLYDYGQNATGRVSLRLSNTKPGQKIIVRYGEKLRRDGHIDNGVYVDIMWPVDNEFDTSNAPFTCRNMDVYICKGGPEEIYEPRFTYTGYQYIEVYGLSGEPDSTTLVNRVFYTDIPETGRFHSSDPLLNRLWSATQWSYRSNILYGPLDCPTREKNFWSGDMACFAPTACLLMDNSRFLSAWTSYGSKIGADFPVRGPSPGWDDEIFVTPYSLWRAYGDTIVLSDNYTRIKKLVDYRLEQSNNNLFTGQETDPYNGDHAQPNGVPGMPKDFINAAFGYYSTAMLSRIAAILGRTEDARMYKAKLNTIKESFNKTYYNSVTGYAGGLQASSVIPIAFGLADTLKVARQLVENIEHNTIYPGHLTTGFIASPLILPVLTASGNIETAWKIIHQPTYPSWSNMLDSGVNTITEEWGGMATNKYNSMNHYVYGAVSQWFFEYLAGIRTDESAPGYKHFMLKPYFPQQLDSIACSYESPYGTIQSTWKKLNGRYIWKIIVPVNTTASVLIPAALPDIRLDGQTLAAKKITTTLSNGRASIRLGSGAYEFSFLLKKEL